MILPNIIGKKSKLPDLVSSSSSNVRHGRRMTYLNNISRHHSELWNKLHPHSKCIFKLVLHSFHYLVFALTRPFGRPNSVPMMCCYRIAVLAFFPDTPSRTSVSSWAKARYLYGKLATTALVETKEDCLAWVLGLLHGEPRKRQPQNRRYPNQIRLAFELLRAGRYQPALNFREVPLASIHRAQPGPYPEG